MLVMDARKDARAATAGSILVTRLAKRGAAGIVSDGGFRDAHGIGQLAMPAYCAGPSAPTNLTLHEALDINVPIGCGDVAVYPGDIIVADDEGAVLIPLALLEAVLDSRAPAPAGRKVATARASARDVSELGRRSPRAKAVSSSVEAR